MLYNKNIGKKLESSIFANHFPAPEGSINFYYGKIGNGKTYAATSDILDLLAEGKIVYANWKITVPDYDDRQHIVNILGNIIFPWKKLFFNIPRNQNLYYFDLEEGLFNYKGEKLKDFNGSMAEFVEWASNLNNCHIFFDEGQDMFDSYEGTRFSKAKRRLILHTRHYNRTINIISQRPTAIQVSARANVNRFYKCVKLADNFLLKRFARYEFQDMTNETVDETVDPISIKKYWGRKKIYNAYNSKYLGDEASKTPVFFDVYLVNLKEKFLLLHGWTLYHFDKIKNFFSKSKKA